MTCIRHMCNCVWQQQDYAEGSDTLPWKSSIPVSLSLRKKRKGRSALNSSGGIGIDLIIITAPVAAAASLPSSFTSMKAF